MSEVDVSWSALAPLLWLAGASVVVLLADLFLRGPGRTALGWIGIAGLTATAAAALGLWDAESTTLAGAFVVDRFGLYFALLLCASTAATLLMSMNYLEQTEIRTGDYYTLVMFAAVGMLLLAMAADLLVIFLAVELMSVAAYALTGMERSSPRSTEAALKYFLLGAFASAFLLFGIALIYGATGSTNLIEIREAVAGGSAVAPLVLGAAALLLVGFGFKIAAVPFHGWSPDAYEGAPTAITAFMAVGVKAAAFAAFARIFLDAFADVSTVWEPLLWLLAVLTMTVGNVTAVVQTNLKRMLAYSSIAHAGYLLIGIVVGGAAGGAALLFYLAVYSAMSLGAFAVMIAAGRPDKQVETLDDLAGLGFRSPLVALAMAVFMLSLAGVPPLAGFAGKFYLFHAAIDSGFVWLTVIAVLNSIVSVYYYAGVIVRMYMHEGDSQAASLVQRPYLALALLASLILTVAIGLTPSALLAAARASFAGIV